MNKIKVIEEMQNKILDEINNWWGTIIDIVRDDNGYIQQIYFEERNMNIMACLTFPHSGTNFHFLLRADYIDSFDRWSNAAYDCWFRSIDDLLPALSSVVVQKELYDIYEKEADNYEI